MRQVAVPRRLDELDLPDPRARIRRLTGQTMGTTWSASVVCRDDLTTPQLLAVIGDALEMVDSQMSAWRESSDLCRFNRTRRAWQPLPPAFATVLACALDVAEQSNGAFDPTVGAMVDLWGFGPARRVAGVPDARALAAARTRYGWERIELDRAAARARQPGGVTLDLSGIAKGFAVDAVAASLDELGIESYLVEIGGELRGRGVKPDAQPWWVQLERPETPVAAGDPVYAPDLLLALCDSAVATSGDYRRGFAYDGRWYSHTIDGRTAAPVAHGLASVTVLAETCMLADAWSTALTVLGPDEGFALATRRGLTALFVARRASGPPVRATPAFLDLLDE